MFANCPDLTTLMSSLEYPDTPEFDRSFAYSELFEGCSGLTKTPKLIFENKYDRRLANEFYEMFANCTSLSTIYAEGKYLSSYFINGGFLNWAYKILYR